MAETLTVLDVVTKSAGFLEKKGVETPRLDAEWLIAGALGLGRMDLYLQFDRPLVEDQLSVMRGYVARRAKREPLQYILGQTPFRDITLKCDERALIPRPETEYLVELAMGSLPEMDGEYRILDLGTGTGAIALALAYSYPLAKILAVDRSKDALALAAENALLTGFQTRVEFRESNWFSGIEEDERFDLIVSNPPYLTDQELAEAQPEVKDFEPGSALVASDEGKADLETLIRGAKAHLNVGASLWLETGIAQHADLLKLSEACEYSSAEGLDDLTGRERFLKMTN
ncbi:MAG: peptide chain release factor N(5)-glutamine methyltransferase [Verrucomicrobiota bacterium]